MGFGGIGAVEQCISEQRMLDFINDKIRDWVAKSATRGLIEEGSNVSVQQFTDVEGSWIKYKGTKPEWMVDPGPSQALFAERERCKRAIFERLGMSELFAQSKKPAGLDSGRALMEYKDTMSERFTTQDQFYEEYVIDCAELVVWCADQLDGFMTTYRDEKEHVLREVKWKDIGMSKDEYKIQIKVASMLPRDPAGRLQKITEIGQQSPEAGQLLMMYMNDPDTESVFNILNAGTNAILNDMERLMSGEPIIPPPFYDLRTLNTAQYLAMATYNKLKTNDSTEVDVITNISNYIQAVISLKLKAQPPPAPLTAAPGGLPGVPMANAPMPGGPGAMPPGMPPQGMPGPGMMPPGGPVQ
jgi:hypothetical protein